MYKIMSSYRTMILLLSILGIGAACGTFIENDFGTLRARELVYAAFWYELVLLLSSLNLMSVIYKTKMYKLKARFVFHIALVIILFGAGLTRYFGIEGTMSIREGKQSNTFTSQESQITLPFSIKLKDFKLTRYPGSRSPSSFSSDITLIDEVNSKKFDKTIFMNNTLTYGGYKFFQNSYDMDEFGTILSVNKDPGKLITYIGYTLLFLGLILSLLNKQSRFQILIKRIKKMSIASFILVFATLIQTPLLANSTYVSDYITEHKANSTVLAEEFGKLVVQARMGRMKTLDSLNREILSKLSGKSSFEGMSANQIVLGMFSRPSIWQKVELIKIKTPKLRKLLKIPNKQKYLKFMDFFFINGNYRLDRYVEEANRLVPSKRSAFYRDVLQVDERINVAFMVFKGTILKVFPIQNDKTQKWANFKKMFKTFDDIYIKRSSERFLDAAYNRNYDKALVHLDAISKFQQEHGQSIMPSKNRLESELFYNKADIFNRLALIYILFGLSLFVYALVSMFFNKLISTKIQKTISFITITLFLTQTFAILLRWYISGYIPLSNTYETMIYIAYCALFVGVLFFRKSILTLSSAISIAGIFMFSAYLGNADPVITNLVPVLKSFWLSIHVSIITASYGFLGVGAMLGFITLILFIMRSPKRVHVDTHIKNLTDINEVTLIIGLVFLVIGNFLGGIWANESWGRYWGWDPKETWAYISIIVYVIVIHLRLLKKFYSVYLFNVLSLVSFSSILMTYFGVNFYLAGKHSYATGDPVPIPIWVYILVSVVSLLIITSYKKRNLKEKNEKN